MWKHGLHPYIVEAASTQYEKKTFLAAGIQAVKNMTTSLMRRRANICNIISHKAAALHACATVSNQSVNRRLSRCKAINLGLLDSAAGPISARVEGVVVCHACLEVGRKPERSRLDRQTVTLNSATLRATEGCSSTPQLTRPCLR